MKAKLFAMFVALLMAGCEEQAQKEVAEGEVKEKAAQIEAENDPSVPIMIPCEACRKDLSKSSTTCPNCGHPNPDSIVAYKKEQESARRRAEEKLAWIRAKEKLASQMAIDKLREELFRKRVDLDVNETRKTISIESKAFPGSSSVDYTTLTLEQLLEEVDPGGEADSRSSYLVFPDLTLNEILAKAIDYKKITDDYTGWAKRIWDNGQIKALGQITDGMKDGLWTEWYESGNKLTEVNYKAGKMDGITTLWHENGKKQSESKYKDGKHNGPWKHWYENGQKKGEGNFQDGKPNGLATLWYENGQKQRETNFKNDELMPLVLTAFVWKPNGEKCPVTNVKDGNGVVVYYNDDGTEGGRRTLKDGELVRD